MSLLSWQPVCNGSIQVAWHPEYQRFAGWINAWVFCGSTCPRISFKTTSDWRSWWWTGVTTTLANEDIAAFQATLSITTISRWMHAVGFRYKKREKHYFVDGHERPETIAYRPIFTNKYLSFELRTHRWIQITKVDSKLLESNGDIAENCGFY